MTTAWDYDLAVGEINTALHTGFLLSEDDALKTYLLGLTVPARQGDPMLPVDVWFRYPEGERRITYPFITIDFLSVDADPSRWTSQWEVPPDYCLYLDPLTGRETGNTGMYVPSTSPTLPPLSNGAVGYHIDPFLMHKITYQVTVHSRSSIHDRYLVSRFMVDVLPPRPFFIPVDTDMTIRRCELLDMTQADTFETTESGNKRIFRKIYTITMDAEIPLTKIWEAYRVSRLHMDIYADTAQREPDSHHYDDPHTIADPVTVQAP